MKYPKEFLVDVVVWRAELAGNEGHMTAVEEVVRWVEEWQVDGEETGRIRLRRRGDSEGWKWEEAGW
jgi:hypothetical protein